MKQGAFSKTYGCQRDSSGAIINDCPKQTDSHIIAIDT